MIEALKRLFIPILILLSLGFILFLINQVSGVYLLANEVHPTFGTVVLITLIVVLAALIISPFILFLKLPKSLKRPTNESQLPAFKKNVLRRLKQNKILKEEGMVPSSVEDLPASLGVLEQRADKVIKSTAQTIFLTTAVSQNGKLDAMTVFLTQIKMVWQIAHIYYQRPSIVELGYLYANIGATSFLASEIEDIDLTKHIEPIISSIAKNTGGRSVPVVGQATTVIMDSLLEGTTNTFLSLRVGILAKKYCGDLTVSSKKELRRSTLKEASVLLRKIAVSSSADFIAAIVRATKNIGINTVKDGWQTVVDASSKVKDGVMKVSKKVNPF